MSKCDLKSLNFEEIKEFTKDILKEKAFRASQIFEWIHKGVENFEEMSNLSKNLREKLNENAYINNISIYEKLVSKLDSTSKYLFLLEDGEIIESVKMEYKHGMSVCISTQVGCRMGCNFCASTMDGLIRNLTPAEMLDQILMIQKDTKKRVDNIVLMGSGEPFDNFENVLKFLDLVNHEKGLNIGMRHITISTCGLVEKIKELSKQKPQINLAISLHSPTDEKRKTIMPIANKYSIDEILLACREYINETSRRITFEYSLVQGFNDTLEDAKSLSKKLKGMLCHINLIPVNELKEREYKKPREDAIKAFKNTLEKSGLNVTIRREMGSDIQGACGQLRRSTIKKRR